MDHVSILQGTLMDYTDWLLKQPNNGSMASSPNDLRGIFYNKLIVHLREGFTKDSLSSYDLRRSIHPDDIIITLRSPGFITDLKFKTDPHLSAHTSRSQILIGLNNALRGIGVLDYHTRLSYELTKIISELKKL